MIDWANEVLEQGFSVILICYEQSMKIMNVGKNHKEKHKEGKRHEKVKWNSYCESLL